MNRFKSAFLGTIALAGIAAAGAANATLITFSEFAVGTIITNQYAAWGVTFSAGPGALPIIANDGAMPDSPVLSPNPPYAGAFEMNFVSGTMVVEFDSGYWDTQGSGVISVYDAADALIGTYTNAGTGVQHFSFANAGGIGRIVFISTADPAGADIDNLNIPEPGTLVLLGAGFLVAGIGRRMNRRA